VVTSISSGKREFSKKSEQPQVEQKPRRACSDDSNQAGAPARMARPARAKVAHATGVAPTPSRHCVQWQRHR
jgi:hypothetical protein